MEHRSDARIGVELDVILYRHGEPVAACKTGNLSSAGMLVRAGPLAFFRNTPLEVGLRSHTLLRTNVPRIPASVVRSSRHGLGLQFNQTDPHIRDAVRALLRTVQEQHP